VRLLERGVDALALLVGHLLDVDAVLPRGDLLGDVPEFDGAVLVFERVDGVPPPPVREDVEGIEGDGGNDGDLDDSSRVIPVGETKKYSLQFEAREVTVDATADAFDATVTATVVEKRRHDCNPSQP